MSEFFKSLFSKKPLPGVKPSPPMPVPRPPAKPSATYQKGDVIGGKYEVRDELGKGAFGVVYLATERATGQLCALKTFRDELLGNASSREAFKKEAHLWIDLDEHPYIVNARWVEEFSGRLFVQMDYIAPDEQGRTTLQDHLTNPDGSLDSVQLLTWGVQFCLGMEHAVSRGVKSHRDIKPGNILITNERILKIADFGLAIATEAAWRCSSEPNDSKNASASVSHLGLSVFKAGGKSWCGTPGYVSPEFYRHGMVDIRSDIYSFGLVLWQMATGSTAPPFLVRYDGTLDEFMQAVYRRQTTSPLPPVDGPIHQVIKRCVSPTPSKRYLNFRELRDDLSALLQDQTGQSLKVPKAIDQSAVLLFQKGGSLISLGRYEEAIECLDEFLTFASSFEEAWNNKAAALRALGRTEEAIRCCDKALEINPRCVSAWCGKGGVLLDVGRYEEAISAYAKASAVDPQNVYAWNGKGASLHMLGRDEEAVECYNVALTCEPRDASAWMNKGSSLASLSRHAEAIGCYEAALAIDPQYASAYYNKALSEESAGKTSAAIRSFRKFITLAPPQDTESIAYARRRIHELGNAAD